MKSRVFYCKTGTSFFNALLLITLVMAGMVQAEVREFTWNPGTSGFNWTSTGNWIGPGSQFPDDNYDKAIFGTKGSTADPILNSDLDGIGGGLGQLVFDGAGWTVWNDAGEDNTINMFSITNFSHNAIYSSGAGTNIIKPKVNFGESSQNVYTGTGNTLVFEQLGGSYAFIASSINPTSADTGAIKLSGNNSSLTNAFLVRQGTLLVANNGALGGSGGKIYFGDNWSYDGAYAKLLTDGAYTVSKDLEVRNITGHQVNAIIGGNQTSGSSQFTGTLTLNRDATLTSANTDGGYVYFTNTISGTGGITKTGPGTVVLAHANTYQGATNINAGRLLISGSSQALPDTTDVTLANVSGAILDLNSNSQTIRSLNGGGGSGGNVALGSAQLTLDGGNFAGSISGTGSLNKTGNGTLTLSGGNSYGGTTSVTQGTLFINGTHTGGGLYTVASNATLGGAGSIYANINVQNGGFLSPASLLHVFGDVNLAGTLKIDLGMIAMNDLLIVGGGLDIANGAVDFDVAAGKLTDPVYVFASYNYLSGQQFANVIDLPKGYTIDYSYGKNNQIALVVIPEPMTVILLGLGAILTIKKKSVKC